MKKIASFLTSFLLVALIMFIPFISFAQDSTATGGVSAGLGLPSWFSIAAGIVLGLYELVIRYVPTSKNWSILGWVIKIIQMIVPNNNSQTPSQPHS